MDTLRSDPILPPPLDLVMVTVVVPEATMLFLDLLMIPLMSAVHEKVYIPTTSKLSTKH